MTSVLEPDTRTIEIGDEQYKVRRLNVRDAFATLRIIQSVASNVQDEIQGAIYTDGEGNQHVDESTLGIIIMTALPECEDKVYDLMGSLIGMDGEDFANNMPPSAPVQIIEHVAGTKDFEDFLRTLRRLWGQDSTIQKLWGRLST